MGLMTKGKFLFRKIVLSHANVFFISKTGLPFPYQSPIYVVFYQTGKSIMLQCLIHFRILMSKFCASSLIISNNLKNGNQTKTKHTCCCISSCVNQVALPFQHQFRKSNTKTSISETMKGFIAD